MRNSYENRLLLVLSFAFGLVFFDRMALSLLFPFVAGELSLDNQHLGWLAAALALAWAVSGVLVGMFADRHGHRRLILVLCILGFSMFSGLSGIVAGFIGLLLFRIGMGLTEGGVLPIAQSLMVQASSPARRGVNMGILQSSSAGLLGAIIAPPLIVMLASAYGWRMAFALTCIPGVLAAWLVWRTVREQVPLEQGALAAPASNAPVVDAEPPMRLLALLRERNVVLCVLVSCCFIAWFINIISFAPTFLVSERGFTPATMGMLMSCLGAAWVGWGALVPAISDRIGRRWALVLFSSIAACCPLVFLFAPSAPVMGALLVLSFTGLGCFPLFMATIPAESVPPRAMATALGLVMGVGEVVGGFAVPVLSGRAADEHGLGVVMWAALVGALLAAVLALGLRETAPSKRGRSAGGKGGGR